MRGAIRIVIGLALAATVTHYVAGVAGGGTPSLPGVLFTVITLAAGGWLATAAETRRIGLVFVGSGVLGSIEPVLRLWTKIGFSIPDLGNDIRFDTWLTHWLRVPQALLVVLIALALYPDGRVRLRVALWFSVAATGATSVAVATHNWPRGDGGAGANPLALPWDVAWLVQLGAYVLAAVALLIVLTSVGLRRRTEDRSTRWVLLIPFAASVVVLVWLLSHDALPYEARDSEWILIALVCAWTVGLTAIRRRVARGRSPAATVSADGE
ncbi:hypothetical protein [Rhizohabitans arisaemae]|uniref:hypothetical protein n=1 Tax=Rhizohabitans arisaemae TaxID=2720610 RepID=UPI0024B20B9D|nr:hypothetical protein [Rhizohabitans arisaemae]